MKFSKHQISQIEVNFANGGVVQLCETQIIQLRLIRCPEADSDDLEEDELDCRPAFDDINIDEPERPELPEPWANTPYRMSVQGEEHLGVTDIDGYLQEMIPAYVDRGILELLVAPTVPLIPFRIGEMEPTTEPVGLQKRLRNLSFAPGMIDGFAGPQTERALKRLQDRYQLERSRETNEDTKVVLVAEHRS